MMRISTRKRKRILKKIIANRQNDKLKDDLQKREMFSQAC